MDSANNTACLATWVSAGHMSTEMVDRLRSWSHVRNACMWLCIRVDVGKGKERCLNGTRFLVSAVTLAVVERRHPQ